MTTDQIAILLIIALTFVLFIWGKWRYDIVSMIALGTLFIADKLLGGERSDLIVEGSNLFIGFAHPAVITVALVLIISRALRNSGVVDLIAHQIAPFSKHKITHISSLSGVVMILSAIMNNVGALALMLPVALKSSVKRKRSPSILLMPLAFASILGGMITMIGTPPNIIIATFRETQLIALKARALADVNSVAANYFKTQNIDISQLDPAPFSMLDFSPVGGVIALVGVLFIALIGWRLIPKTSLKKPGKSTLFSIDEYITEVRIPLACTFIGVPVREIEDFTKDRLTIFGHILEDETIHLPNNEHVIKKGDRFLVKADPVELRLMMNEYGLRLTKIMRERINQLKDKQSTFFREVLVTQQSLLEGQNRAFLRKRTSNSVILMALARRGQPIRKRLGKIVFHVGDVLLLQGNIDNLEDTISSLELIPLAERNVKVGVFSKVSTALLIFGAAIVLSMFGVLPVTVSFSGAILMYIFTGILPISELYKQIDWPIIVLLGAMIPVSNALQSTGTTGLIADIMLTLTQDFPVWFILGIIMVFTMTLSDVINNAATALIMAPIAVEIAVSLGLSIDPFLMSVAVGASCAFLTPIGHQCNALVLGPGAYKFSDYWKMGLPLEILIVIIGTPLILYFWPL
ncbi:MAG: SLC13 family permease [Flavobacteriaceae bacterium]|nr:MAG: SLC13 family permease [Flavobacteriaceae bacterium]